MSDQKPIYRPSAQSIVFAVALGIIGWTLIAAGLGAIL